MNVLEKILEEIEEKFKTADAEKFDCEELCDVEDWYDSGYIDGQLSAYEKCMDIIRSHMGDGKDTNVPSNEGWIPVEERLPEDERMVLVTCQTKKGIRSTNRAYYDGAFWYGSGSMSSVTAWQPLPDPYKPK